MPSVPAPPQTYSPSTPLIANALGTETTDLSFTNSATDSLPDIGFAANESAPYSPAFDSPPNLPSITPNIAPVAASSADVSFVPGLSTSEADARSSFVPNDGLPYLAPADLSDRTALPTATPSVTQPNENLSIGTAILRDLQYAPAYEVADSNIQLSSSTAAAVPEPYYFNGDEPSQGQLVSQQSQPISILPEETISISEPASIGIEEAPAYTYSELAGEPAGELTSESASSETVIQPVGLANSQLVGQAASDAVYSQPTLSQLTQTMPDREMSPLVASFRASSRLSSPNQGSIESKLRPDDPSPLLNELLDGISSNEASPMLSRSTIYMPIAAETRVDSPGTLIQAAIDTLATEASTPELIDAQTRQSAFSSVLSSDALSNSSPAALSPAALTQKPAVLELNVFEKLTPAKIAIQRAKARRAAVTLAASRQVSKRRQRVTWL